MQLSLKVALYGYHLILLHTFAFGVSSSAECWPSVDLHNTTETPSESSLVAQGGIPAALWIRGLPCMGDECCSTKVKLRQGAMSIVSPLLLASHTSRYVGSIGRT